MHILKNGEKVCQSAKELILQPQSEIENVREFLREEGYAILAEDMVLEDGKFYPMMKVQYQGENAQKASEVLKLSDLYGGLLLQNRHPVLKTFLEKEKLIYTLYTPIFIHKTVMQVHYNAVYPALLRAVSGFFLTQAEFAKQVGIATSTISEWKKRKTNPTADKIMDICNVLQITPEQLLTGKACIRRTVRA